MEKKAILRRRLSSTEILYQDNIGLIFGTSLYKKKVDVIGLPKLLSLRTFIIDYQFVGSSLKACGGY